MREGPDLARIAALVADPARSTMLLALMDGRALTATELASLAGVTKQTASSHLEKLLDGEVLAAEAQGRHRYFRLAGAHVAANWPRGRRQARRSSRTFASLDLRLWAALRPADYATHHHRQDVVREPSQPRQRPSGISRDGADWTAISQ
ncbi:winged helix-turn-helix domain-containing protein [Falsirhodobacter deserti]|uniref:ArsR/SmtB family transcription factor n=1 Tax=Falsirhodobacter deserti TaxID=1365611 RepID=UPI0030C88AB5